MARASKKPPKEKPAAPVVSQAIFNTFYAEYCEYRQKADDANSALRGSLKRAKAAGIETGEMIAARAEQRMDPEKLRAKIRAREQYRAFMGLPVGAQPSMFGDAAAEPKVDDNLTDAERARAAGEMGLEAGKAGHARDTNPHPPGSELHAAFDRAWVQGQETIAEKLTRRKPRAADAEHAAGHA